MRTIFLDIDGVLNGDGTKDWIPVDEIMAVAFPDVPFVGAFGSTKGMTGFCPSLLARLSRILKAVPDAEVVLSSSWRKRFSLEGIERWLAERGLQLKFAGSTPLSFNGHRGHEICDWLEDHPEVQSFVILEDGSDISPSLKSHWVQPDCRTGLSDKDVEDAIRILRRNGS